VSPLPVLGVERLHPLPTGVYLTVLEIPSGEPDFEPPPAWVSRTPGVYRSTDLAAWEPLAVGPQLGEEIVAIDDTLVMVGTDGTKCWKPGRCGAAAWRSTDGGRTWVSVPVSGTSPVAGGSIKAVAALPDGTLVAVGNLTGTNGWGYAAAWISPPERSP
jgi:hypothetical protein